MRIWEGNGATPPSASFRTELQIYPLSNRFYTTTGVLAPSTPNQLVIAPSPNRNEDVSNRVTIRADCISTVVHCALSCSKNPLKSRRAVQENRVSPVVTRASSRLPVQAYVNLAMPTMQARKFCCPRENRLNRLNTKSIDLEPKNKILHFLLLSFYSRHSQ